MVKKKMSANSKGINWDGVSEEMARQILHQGELYLQAQLQAGIAADQRAITAASVFVAVATAVLGGTLAYLETSWPENAVVGAGFVSGILMTLAAAGCFWSARPVPFDYPGNHPEQWWVTRTKNLTTAIGGEAENYQSAIATNRARLESNAWWFRLSMAAAMLSPCAATAVWLAVTFSS